jgi:hypothetical protein
MITTGQTIEHPVTGERLAFLETVRETGGASDRFQAVIAPGRTLASAHQHSTRQSRLNPQKERSAMHQLVTRIAATVAAVRARRAEELQRQFEESRRSHLRPVPRYLRFA